MRRKLKGPEFLEIIRERIGVKLSPAAETAMLITYGKWRHANRKGLNDGDLDEFIRVTALRFSPQNIVKPRYARARF